MIAVKNNGISSFLAMCHSTNMQPAKARTKKTLMSSVVQIGGLYVQSHTDNPWLPVLARLWKLKILLQARTI